MEKIDLKKQLKPLYTGRRLPVELEAGTGRFLVVSGKGSPGGEAFQNAFQLLFGTVFTLKFSLLLSGIMDFAVCPPECSYLDDPACVPMDDWRWQLMIRVPSEVSELHLANAKSTLLARKRLDASAVSLEDLQEGRCLQQLHVGPYDQICQTYRSLTAGMEERGLTWAGPPKEVYLSDPRRTPAEKLKTIVRIPVTESARAE